MHQLGNLSQNNQALIHQLSDESYHTRSYSATKIQAITKHYQYTSLCHCQQIHYNYLLYRGEAIVKVSGYYAARRRNNFQLEPQILKPIQSFHSNITFCQCQKQLQNLKVELNYNTGVAKLGGKDILG